jgi:hypothetical protein
MPSVYARLGRKFKTSRPSTEVPPETKRLELYKPVYSILPPRGFGASIILRFYGCLESATQ